MIYGGLMNKLQTVIFVQFFIFNLFINIVNYGI